MTNNYKDLLLRHSIESERKRYSFITKFNTITKRSLQELLIFSQTGNDDNFLKGTYYIYFILMRLITDFGSEFGYVDE